MVAMTISGAIGMVQDGMKLAPVMEWVGGVQLTNCGGGGGGDMGAVGQLVSLLLCCLQLLACRPVLISRHLENLSEPPSAAWSALCSSVWVWLSLVVVVVSCMCVYVDNKLLECMTELPRVG